MTTVGRLFKESMVNNIKQGVTNNDSVFLMSYRNISGTQLSDLRKDLKKVGATVFVSRNAIVKIALKELEQENLANKVDGQTALVWSNEDSVEVSKILVKFQKAFEGVMIQGGLLQERVLEQEDIKALADLPSKDQLRVQLLSTIQAPVTRLLNIFSAKSRDLLSILKQLSERSG